MLAGAQRLKMQEVGRSWHPAVKLLEKKKKSGIQNWEEFLINFKIISPLDLQELS